MKIARVSWMFIFWTAWIYRDSHLHNVDLDKKSILFWENYSHIQPSSTMTLISVVGISQRKSQYSEGIQDKFRKD